MRLFVRENRATSRLLRTPAVGALLPLRVLCLSALTREHARIFCCVCSSVCVCVLQDWAGVKASLGPQIVFSPAFAVFYAELKGRFPKPSEVSVSATSTLLIKGGGNVTIEGLKLDGTLEIEVGS